MAPAHDNLDQQIVTTIRTLSIDAIQKANSGHPGAPMGLAPAGYVLWKKYLKHNPGNPAWIDRDRFVLSGGHASMLLYSLLYLFGYGLELDDLKNFRQWGSRTPGHPEYNHTPGVETTTGPLGQGIANAVGMAMAERHMAARFNREGKTIIDHHTYVICGDGDLMEGVAMEAVSLAGHQALGKLIMIYDDNGITIEGPTGITFTENVPAKFEAMNWHVITVEDGNNLEEIGNAVQAGKDETGRPSLIRIKTHIAWGSPNKQDSAGAHGAPLGEEEVRLTKAFYGAPEEAFHVPEAVLNSCREALEDGHNAEQAWQHVFDEYREEFPELAGQFTDALCGFLPEGWDENIPVMTPADKPVATRSASGKVINAIAPKILSLMGGSADLAPSNNTYINSSDEFQKATPAGRNIRFGVREHAMGAIMSGMYLHSGIRPFGGTFLVFADYMRPAIRVAALMKLPLIYVFTHDSVAVGEDGPTHQPVEQITCLRAIPGLHVIRPADANETAQAWKCALDTLDAPTALILSRQNLPILEAENKDGELKYGAYIIKDSAAVPNMILIASGSEVHLCLAAAEILEKENNIGVRVVSMPSWELFESAPRYYRERILPPNIRKRIAVEAGISLGWERYVFDRDNVIAIDRFGASAPGGTVLKEYGINKDNIVEKAMSLMKN